MRLPGGLNAIVPSSNRLDSLVVAKRRDSLHEAGESNKEYTKAAQLRAYSPDFIGWLPDRLVWLLPSRCHSRQR